MAYNTMADKKKNIKRSDVNPTMTEEYIASTVVKN